MNKCERCQAEVEPAGYGVSTAHGIEDCLRYLGAENESLKEKLKALEERFDRVVDRHNLDDSRWGKNF